MKSLISFVLLAALAGAQTISYRETLLAYKQVKVAEGVYAFIQPESKIPLVSGNQVAIIGEDSVLVVDSGHFPSLTRRVIADIRKLTSKPVKYLVNTHWHADHVSGNGEYRSAWPGLTIISTPETRERLAHPLPQYDDLKQANEFLPFLRKALAEGKDDRGNPLSAADKEYFQMMVDVGEVAVPEFKLASKFPADAAFKDSLDISLGNRDVQLRFLGRGNTRGDAVVYIPDAKVLITGDLLVSPIPYAHGSFPGDWSETMKALAKLDAASIVPGHGDVQTDRAYLETVTALLESVTSQVKTAAAAGLSLEETRKRLDVTDFQKKLCGDDPARIRSFRGNFLGIAVTRAYREAKEGRLLDEN